MKFLCIAFLYVLAMSGCAATAVPADLRIGTERTPYRSIPTYIECGDCSLSRK